MGSDHVERLKEDLEALGYLKVVQVKESEAQIRLLCRISNKKAWLEKLERLLLEVKSWKPHICQQYFIKEGAGMVYGWNIVINSSDIPATVAEIHRVLTGPEHIEVDTFPLRGAWRPPENASFSPSAPGPGRGGVSHRGAFPIGGGSK